MANLCRYHTSIAWRASPYLFPCTVEYSLLAAAMLYKMYHNVGRIARHTLNVSSLELRRRYTDCHKANKGLFLGLFIAVITLIAVSCFFVFDQEFNGSRISSLIYFVTEILLLTLSAFVVIVAFVRFQQLRFVSLEDGEFDSILLVTAYCGICLFNCFLVIAAAQNLEQFGLTAILALAGSGLVLVQGTMQLVFILDGLRRCADSHDHVHRKPGRELLTFLLLCNLSMWVMNTFAVDHADTVPLYEEFYGTLAWSILSHICIPLIIFFRFHSTVCLSDIWINAYKVRAKER